MAMTAAERKRRQREKLRDKALDIKPFQMELAASERQAIAEMAELRDFDDQTEYLLALVYKDRDMSQKTVVLSEMEHATTGAD